MKFEDKNKNIITTTFDAENYPAAREIVKEMGAIKILEEEIYKNFNQGPNEYLVHYFSGSFKQQTIFASSKEHAAEICEKYCEAKASNVVDKNEKVEIIESAEEILPASDAEAYLYEMDMNGVDYLTFRAAGNLRSKNNKINKTIITREDCLKALPHLKSE